MKTCVKRKKKYVMRMQIEEGNDEMMKKKKDPLFHIRKQKAATRANKIPPNATPKPLF